MVPTDANFTGNVFGGSILAEVDRVAYISATRHAAADCVTASFDRVDFLAPVHVGQVVEFDAVVTYAGRTSMEVLVRIRAEDLKGGPRRMVGNAYVTMVAVDAGGRPQLIPALHLANEEERRRFAEAQARVDARRRTRAKGTNGVEEVR
jgi:acyl-CoA hydrolase